MNEQIDQTGGEAFDTAMQQANTEDAAAQAVGAVAAILGQAEAMRHAIEGISREDDVPPELQYFSLGHACELLQLPPSGVRDLMRRAGVRFSLVINDVCHLDGVAVLKLNRLRREVAKSCRSN